ncbi:NAD(P)/FAD-dependent oxidoreductase [Streptomyces sp. ACA25]|uniref:phytoene desaturase family protein n=1 Tax=Streptomyces sp. ACA25 TaxID=3022596 RepID=UPI002307FABD|nr:NAD(P)/FAD-dependent oxidoreductase [Streptomyces sp. ACA25]MDB1086065.1 NAD(P)/FAD-dependent oxidoreductase [Streptomyces sp. ACA25]
MTDTDVAVVGTGPNGLAAGVTLARAGLRVELYEAADTIGGGLRGAALFDTDIEHDVCAAVHPMAAASRFFREFDLAARGVELLRPEISYGHPLAGGRAALAWRDLSTTCAALGPDGDRWRRLMEPLLEHGEAVVDQLLSGQRGLPDPRAALLLAPRALAHGLRARGGGFAGEEAPALLAGVAAHVMGPLPSLPGAAVTMLLGHLAHSSGWPLPRGGSRRIAEALADDITAHGGVFHTGRQVTDLRELSARTVLLDTAPAGLLELAGDRLPRGYARRLERYRYGPAAGKADFLVSGPIPWKAPGLGRAGTVHLGGTAAEIFRQETANARGEAAGEPFVLVVDPAVTDPGRARAGRRPVWAYAHLPPGDRRDPVALIRSRIEHYAPGFTDTVLAERGLSGAAYQEYNPNYVGGDIGTGAITLRQSLLRPVARWDPYRTPLPGVYLCSAATPPGPSVHGMCGYLAARSALRREFGLATPALAPPSRAVTGR